MKGAMGREYEQREVVRVDIDPNLVQSGDLLATVRTDGLNAFNMYSTGASVGHTAMALWFDGELYVVEADATIVRRPWSKWVNNDCAAAGYGIVWHRLSE